MANNPKVAEILKKLGREEERTVHGANILTPRQTMLDAREVAEAHPDKWLRWLNLKNPDKLAARRMDGYVRLSDSEGGRQLGDECALFAIPKSRAEEKIVAIEEMNRQRLSQHVDEMRAVVAGVVKELRDKHGIKLNESRIFVQE